MDLQEKSVLNKVTVSDRDLFLMGGKNYLLVQESPPISGEMSLFGSKNASLPIMASLILTSGVSRLHNIPGSADVINMCQLLKELGAGVDYNSITNVLVVDSSSINSFFVSPEIMQKMRASVLVMGPLLARFGRAEIALPGGCAIGARPIDYHIKAFKKMGVECFVDGEILTAHTLGLKAEILGQDYPSVGATENILMAAVLTQGETILINVSLEPEVLDFISVLKKMGAKIEILAPATIKVTGVTSLNAIDHEVIPDRLEAGALLLAAAISGGEIYLPGARDEHLSLFLLKLREMGHTVISGSEGKGIRLIATDQPQAISLITGSFPAFPTDLQSPMMAALCVAQGESVIRETVFENRLIHVPQLRKLGADITVSGDTARIKGVQNLIGTTVEATDIRASCSLVLAGLVAKGSTCVMGAYHWKRGYQLLDKKLAALGAIIKLETR